MHSDDFQSFLKTVLPDMGYRWRRFDRRNIKRRIRLRMEALGIHDLEKYADLLINDASERKVLDPLLRLTITRFFRNPWLWQELEKLLIQSGQKPVTEETLSLWSAGCAGGEEPFSIAMLLDDLSRSGKLERPWSILGSDTDPASLSRVNYTSYKWGSVREIPGHLLDRWFTEESGLWIMDQGVRSMVRFDKHDLVTQNPPGQYHLVFLRNSVLTYNTEEVQRNVLSRIRECLLKPGYLIIGRTESLPDGAGFEEVSRCIYRKREQGIWKVE